MTVRIVRLGTARIPGDGTRIGTVRRPPRGVPKTEFAKQNWYDVWFPNLAPSLETMKLGRDTTARLCLLGIMLCCEPVAAQTTTALAKEDKLLTERSTHLFTVGTAEGEDWAMFAGIRSVAFDREDNLYVLDAQNSRVVVFDRRGRFVRQFGKRGAGPGEMGAPIHIAVNPTGEVVVNDARNRAFIVYATTGTHNRNISYSQLRGSPTEGMYADQYGGLVVLTNATPRDDGNYYASVFRLSLQDNALPALVRELRVYPPTRLPLSGTAFVVRDAEFAVHPMLGILPRGRIVVQNDVNYRLEILDGDGRLRHSITRPINGRKVTKEDRDEWQKREARALVARGLEPRKLPYEIPFAEFMSAVSGLRTDPQGRMWIQRRQKSGAEEGPIDLITGGGRYIGTLHAQPLPSAVSESNRAAYVVRNELNVEQVAVLQLPATWKQE